MWYIYKIIRNKIICGINIGAFLRSIIIWGVQFNCMVSFFAISSAVIITKFLFTSVSMALEISNMHSVVTVMTSVVWFATICTIVNMTKSGRIRVFKGRVIWVGLRCCARVCCTRGTCKRTCRPNGRSVTTMRESCPGRLDWWPARFQVSWGPPHRIGPHMRLMLVTWDLCPRALGVATRSCRSSYATFTSLLLAAADGLLIHRVMLLISTCNVPNCGCTNQ